MCIVDTNPGKYKNKIPHELWGIITNMEIIFDKIRNDEVLDSEIIKNINNYPKFDINWVDNCGWTLLMYLVFRNRKELAEYLLTHPNIDVNYKNHNGYTALYYVCWCGNILMLKLLLSHKDIYVNIQHNFGDTGMHIACCCNHIEIVKELLLDARVNPLIRDIIGRTDQYLVTQKGYIKIANMFKRIGHTSLLRIPNEALCRDIVRMITEEYT